MEERKQYGAHARHSVKVHIAVLWTKTSYSLVQTFWRHTMTIVSECVCWTLKHTTKTHVSITLKSAIRNKFHICRFAGRDSSVGIVTIVTEELWFDSQQQ